ncbi:MAG TPA: HEPN domain-containing protein [Cyclobacteriaceae bacterium]|nr:HEPN domain-containing protein [Cyclobacteriaceae bacterium]
MIHSKVSSTLHSLIKEIRDHPDDFLHFEPKEILNRQELYTRTRGKVEEYSKGIKRMQWSTEYFNKDDKTWINFKSYFERLSAKYSILNRCFQAIKNEYQLNEQEVHSTLGAFLYYVLFKNEKYILDETIIELVTVFINDLNKTAPEWKIKLWIKGIWLNDEIIDVSNELTIRKPVNDDFVLEQPSYSYFSSMISATIDSCDSIIEIRKKFEDENAMEDYLTKLIQSLRLYNLGAVQVNRREYKPNSILLRYGVPYSLDIHSFFQYEVTSKESNDIRAFLDFMLDFLPPMNWASKIQDQNPIYISIERYSEAITKSMAVENKITTAITALEALLLKANERSELSHKLSQRVSYLSQYFKYPPIKVYNVMKRAYEIRSTYIHGSMLGPTERKDLGEIQNQILNLLRRILLIFIGLSKLILKDELIAKIDNAIIDRNANEKLVKELMRADFLKLTAYNTGFEFESTN